MRPHATPKRDSAERASRSPPSRVRLVKHKRPSLREVFDEYAPFLWRALRHLGIAESDIEDVCQEVFIVVHRKLDTFEWRSSLRTWLYGICLRVARDYRTSARVRYEVVVADPPPRVADPTQEHELSYKDAHRLLEAVLDRLDEDKRAIFVLYELEQLPMTDIAEAAGCPLQTAYSRLHAARAIVVKAARELEKAARR